MEVSSDIPSRFCGVLEISRKTHGSLSKVPEDAQRSKFDPNVEEVKILLRYDRIPLPRNFSLPAIDS